jgi:tetratricopeptide (TPR) repeat protein
MYILHREEMEIVMRQYLRYALGISNVFGLIWFGEACSPDSKEPIVEAIHGISLVETQVQLHPEADLQFVDVTRQSGVDFVHSSGTEQQRFILESMAGGGAFFDYDGDGLLDLFLVNGGAVEALPEHGNRLYRNTGQASEPDARFIDVTAEAGVGRSGWGMGCAVGDYDNDGDIDLYVTNWGPNVLYRNEDGGHFTEVTDQAGVGDEGWGSSAAFGDLDADGFLDLFAANYLEFDLPDPAVAWRPCDWKGLEVFCGPMGLESQANVLFRNDRAGGFVDVSEKTGVARHKHPSLGIVFGDFDGDGDQDLYIANDSMPNLLYRNDGQWRLTEVGMLAGVAFSENGREQAGMGIASGDYDNDGDFDLLVTNFSDDSNTLYQNQNDGSFLDATAAAGLDGEVRPYLGWSTAFFDSDNDGWLDLFVANGHIYPQVDLYTADIGYAQRNLFYRNIGGLFQSSASSVGLEQVKVSRGAAFGDYDNDGDTDILVINLNDTPTLLENRGGNHNNWLGLELVGVESNRDALGARVRLAVGEQMQTREVHSGFGYQSQHDDRVLFGLGNAAHVDYVEIRWPNGHTQRLEDPPLGRYHVIVEDAEAILSSYGGAKSQDQHPRIVAPAAEQIGAQPRPSQIAASLGWTAADHLKKGVELYEQRRFEEALNVLRPAVELQPDSLDIRYAVAVVLFGGLGKSEEAAAVLETAMLRDSSLVKINKLLGDIYLSLNRTDRAKQVLVRTSDLAPEDWESQNLLGLVHRREGDLAAAAAAFRQAALRAPWEPHPHLNLARLYRRQGHLDAAEGERRIFKRLRRWQLDAEWYLEKIGKDSTDVESHFYLGRTYLQQGRHDRALWYFRLAVQLDPDFGLGHYGWGALLHSRGRLEEAIEAYQQAYRCDPQLVVVLNDLGLAYHQAGRVEEALATYQKALAVRPDLALSSSNLGDLLAAQGKSEEAIAHYKAALQTDPDLKGTQKALIGLYASEKRFDKAKREQRILMAEKDSEYTAPARASRELRYDIDAE